jgi:fimbrial isopeptide formation D2 family protein/LPXTG-motif cell wall-anchored protein/uncharacterized repeat protein (TIGR01451 family)
VNPDGQRGDNDLLNFAFPTGTTPPATCVAGDPLCTEHKVPQVSVTKTSDPVDGSTVAAGESITYTLTFQNTGKATGQLDYVDYLADVVDDATLSGTPTASSSDVTVGTVSNDQLPITGTIPAGATYTVTYKVSVLPYAQQGNHALLNYVAKPGTAPPPPGTCVTDPTCVVHPVRHLSITKSASTTARPAPGDPVSYTVIVTNDGGTDYPAANPATATDDLSDVLDDATYNGDVAATSGTPAVSGSQLTWSGPLAQGDAVTITYSVTYHGTGDTVMKNTACVPKQGTDPNCDSVSVPAALITPSKSVDPADGSTVAAGQVLTYTLTLANSGKGAGDVDYTDDLSKVLDDATITDGPTASNSALTVSPVANGTFEVTGTVPASTTYTVTVKVQVKPDGQRGDNQLDNFLVPTGQQPPATCADDDPMCTHNPVPEIVPAKAVDPASGTAVQTGQVLTYTLTFHNIGAATGSVDYIDYLADVLDDATLTSSPAASSPDLTVGAVSNGQFEVTGTVPVDATYTVSYQVTIKPEGQRGNDTANNFLAAEGQAPPTTCEQPAPDTQTPAASAPVLCTTNPMPELQDWKTAEPASSTPLIPGQTVTYTLHFTNKGTAPGDVDKVDDITQAVDDATVASQPTSSDPAMTVTPFGADHRAHITGTLAAGQTVAVTYKLTVNAAGKLGDSILANFILKPSDPPPSSPDCKPTNTQQPDCTSHPIGTLQVAKTVAPKNFSQVQPGDTLSYTLSFHNVGKGATKVGYTDHLTGVLDDATVTGTPTASDSALTASTISNGTFTVTGTLAAGRSVTVTYKVQLKPYSQQGNHQADNFLDPTGTTPPSRCVSTNPLCTHNPIPAPGTPGTPGSPGSPGTPTHPGSPPLAFTGDDSQLQLILAGLLVGVGGLLVLASRRRKHHGTTD